MSVKVFNSAKEFPTAAENRMATSRCKVMLEVAEKPFMLLTISTSQIIDDFVCEPVCSGTSACRKQGLVHGQRIF